MGDDRVYGFPRILLPGGKIGVSNVKIVLAPEYLDIAANLGGPDVIGRGDRP